MSDYLRVLARQHRVPLGLMAIVPGALTALVVPMYDSTYPTEAARQHAVALARANQALTVLYGNLPEPGTSVQMAVWETGALTALLVAVVAVPLTVALSRSAEEAGTVELARSCGVRTDGPVRAAVILLGAVAVVLGIGCGLGLSTLRSATLGDALAYGGTLALTLATVCAATLLVAQLVASAGASRSIGFVLIGVAFLLRALADSSGKSVIGWISPLALRAEMAPGSENRWWPGLLAALAGLMLTGCAVRLAARRDLGSGVIPPRHEAPHHLRVRSAYGLAARLGMPGLAMWTVGMTIFGLTFAAMGHSAVASAKSGDVSGGVLGSQLAGDPAVGYLRYVGIMAAILVAAHCLSVIGRVAADEKGGLLELVRSTGTGRPAPLVAATVLAAVHAGVLLLATTLGAAVTAPSALGVGFDEAVRQILGQWPAAALLLALAALLVGLTPHAVGWVWLVLGSFAGAALLGGLLRLPAWVTAHNPITQAGEGQSAVWGALAVVAALLGWWSVGRRDLAG